MALARTSLNGAHWAGPWCLIAAGRSGGSDVLLTSFISGNNSVEVLSHASVGSFSGFKAKKEQPPPSVPPPFVGGLNHNQGVG